MPRRHKRRRSRKEKRAIRWRWLAGLVVLFVVLAVGLPQGKAWRDHSRVEQHMPLVEEHALPRGLPPELVRAVIKWESSGRPRVVSSAGAVGLMQITPITERDVLQRNPGIAKGDLKDPRYNILIGTTYLRQLLDRFGGDVRLSLAAYHMGPTAVSKARRQHPQLNSKQLIAKVAGPKTRAYVRNVLRDAERGYDAP